MPLATLVLEDIEKRQEMLRLEKLNTEDIVLLIQEKCERAHFDGFGLGILISVVIFILAGIFVKVIL